MDKLDNAMTVMASPRTGVISLSVTLRDPVLAQAVTQQLLDELNTSISRVGNRRRVRSASLSSSASTS